MIYSYVQFQRVQSIHVAAAVAYGACSAQGFELPENQANAFIFKAAIQFSQIAKLKIPKSSVLSLAQIVFEDIKQVRRCFHLNS
jgi:hypothetical protein